MHEEIVLGGLLLNNERIHDVVGLLTVESFAKPKLANLYRHILQAHYEDLPFDTVSLSDTLGDSWIGFCGELVSLAAQHGNVWHHANLVHEAHRLRDLQKILSVALGKSTNRTNSQEIIDELSLEMTSLEKTAGSQIRKISDSLEHFVDDLEERFNSDGNFTGLSTGLEDLDRSIMGMLPGDFVVIAGRPAMGKTVLAQNIAEHNATQGKNIVFFSLEMTEFQLQQRLVSSVSGVDYSKIQSAECIADETESLLLADGISKIKKMSFAIDDSPSLSVMELRSKAIAYDRKVKGIDLIVIDYLQLLSAKSESRFQEVSQISRELKRLAKTLNCPVIALSQLNRSLEQRSDKRPVMADLRESGQIEQDADKIIFIYRDEVYDPNSMAKGYAELILGKARNTEKKDVVAVFDGAKQSFRNAELTGYNAVINSKEKRPKNEFSTRYGKTG